jgi:TRAP transporter TAXI family solute receptor
MRSLVIAAALGALLGANAASAQSYNLTLSGASPGGLWSAIGQGIDAALAKSHPGSTVTYQTSSGGLANIQLVSNGGVPMGLATDGELKYAHAGKEPFKSPVTDVRVLFRVYAPESRFQMTHLILSKSFAEEHGVKTFADIVSKKLPVRVAVNRRGNLDGDVSVRLMEEMGATLEAIESWGGQVVRAASKEQVSLYLDRRIDLINVGLSFNHPRFQEATKGVESILVPVPESAAATVAEEFGGAVCEAAPGEYDWSAEGSKSVCIGAMVVVNESLDDQTASDLAKAMVEQIEEFKEKSHRAIKKTVSEKVLATPGIAPTHSGAEKYYREKGLL